MLTWFGEWPAWTRLFLESCRHNSTVDWLLITDCGEPPDLPANVKLFETTFADYHDLVGRRLGIRPQWSDPYKLCDLKPALGYIHADALAGYDYWGFGDLDVIYGDIRAILTPDLLDCDLLSSHTGIVAGHFCVLRHSPEMLAAFMRVRGWRARLARDVHCSFDEQIFSRLFLPVDWRRPWRRLQTPWLGGAQFVEQFSTSIPPLPFLPGAANYPTKWFWRDGKLTNDVGGEREFLYVHFSHWQSNRWTQEPEAPWRTLDRLDKLPPGRPAAFCISRDGFTPLPDTPANPT